MRPAARCAGTLSEQGVDVSQFRLFESGQSSVSGILVDSTGERQIVNFRGKFPEQADWLRARTRLAPRLRCWPIRAGWRERRRCSRPRARSGFRPSSMPMSPNAQVFETLLPLADHAVFSEPALSAFVGSTDRGGAGQGRKIRLPRRRGDARRRRRQLARERCRPSPAGLCSQRDRYHRRRRRVSRRLRLRDRCAPCDAADAMSFAAAAAALKCTRPGGRAGIPTLEDCLAFQRNGQ